MEPRVVFYQLRTKFVNRREDIPEEARQVVYYSLAVGHHVGVMDCFSMLAEAPLQEFSDWLQRLPPGAARSKLEGVLTWGEIEINNSHAAMLLPHFESAEVDKLAWMSVLADGLRCMQQEPAYYWMVRKLA
jgi:hypothetical protein